MRIACVLAADFEDSEFKDPYEAFLQAGHEVTVIGLKANEPLKGKKGQVTVRAEKSFADVSTLDFDALLIPGGNSPDKLRAHDEPVVFVKSMMTANKVVLAICHGPQLLLTAEEYKRHRMTAWKTVQGDLKKAGADVVDREVVVDRNLVTSRMPPVRRGDRGRGLGWPGDLDARHERRAGGDPGRVGAAVPRGQAGRRRLPDLPGSALPRHGRHEVGIERRRHAWTGRTLRTSKRFLAGPAQQLVQREDGRV